MAITERQVLDALSNVEEPDLHKDLVTLNMIKDIVIEGNRVKFTVILTTPACPLKEKIRKDCENAILEYIAPDIDVVVDMTAEVTSSRNSAPILPNVKNIIAVASGKGGVGKSTVTANLALALAKTGATVGIIDADIYGPSIPVMYGVEDQRPDVLEMEGQSFIVPIKQYGVKIISMGFLAPAENAVVWRGPMASKALRQFLTDTQWGDLDYLLIDLPPGTSDIHLTLVQTVPVTGVVLVTTPQKVALADAIRGIAMFKQPNINVPILGLVENMAYFTPEELPENKYYIFGKEGGKQLAKENDLAVLGEIPLVQSIREAGDEGVPAVAKSDELTSKAFKVLAESLAQKVAIRNAKYDKTKVVEVKTNF